MPASNEKFYMIDSDQAALAVSFLDYHNETSQVDDLFRYVRPVYMTAFSDDNGKGWEDIRPIEAIPCAEAFANVTADQNHMSLEAEIETYGPWYCPKVDDYKLMNGNGFSLFMTIHTCQQAIALLGNGDAATDCENNEAARSAYVDGNIQVNTKYISKYFNIDIYTETQDLEYLGYQYFQTLLYEETFQHLSYVVQENNVQVY